MAKAGNRNGDKARETAIEPPERLVEAAPAAVAHPPQDGPSGRANLFRVGDIVSILRREVAAAAATVKDAPEGSPAFAIANVDFELACVVAAVDGEGPWIALHGADVKGAAAGQVSRMRLSIVDVDIAALNEAAAKRDRS